MVELIDELTDTEVCLGMCRSSVTNVTKMGHGTEGRRGTYFLMVAGGWLKQWLEENSLRDCCEILHYRSARVRINGLPTFGSVEIIRFADPQQALLFKMGCSELISEENNSL
jgi:hypothetical protein